jgi:hypothetical protein
VKICEKLKKADHHRLFFFRFVVTAFIVLAVTAAKTTGSDHAENAQENKTVGNPEEIVEIYDTKEFSTGEKADDPSKHQQGAENAGCPSEIIDDCTKFHIDSFLVNIKVN